MIALFCQHVHCSKLVSMMHAGVTEKHFKEKLSRVLGLGNTAPDAATMTTAVRGLMFGDYIVAGQLIVTEIHHADWALQVVHMSCTCYRFLTRQL